MKSILVVDDDRDLQNVLRLSLEHAGYEVVSAFSGEQALEIVENYGVPHLVIVDINMPGMTGLEFCDKLQEFSDVPIIILTSEADTDVLVNSIEQYAEDYMTKPFVTREFLARVDRLLRRVHSFDYAMEPSIQIDDHLQVSLGRKTVTVDGQENSLTPTEAKLLHVFLNNRDRIVPLEFLLNRLWPHEEVFEDRLRVHVHRLRRKIDNGSRDRTHIVTERGLGYRFRV